jgi:hypothetical protein
MSATIQTKKERVELVHNVQNGNFKPITQVIRTYGYLTRGCEFNPLFDHPANYYSIQPTHLLFRFRVRVYLITKCHVGDCTKSLEKDGQILSS